MRKKLLPLFLLGLFLGERSQAVVIQIVADNDFAILVGTPTTIERLVYQNDVVWNQQITNASSFSLSLQSVENTIYLLAMGGGGEENISGRINGVDISTLTNIQVSSAVQGSLSGYSTSYSNGGVADGTYNASLLDLQNALPNLTWTAAQKGTGTVISLSGFSFGYPFSPGTAVLYRFSADQVGVPEPSAFSLVVVGLGALAAFRRRQSLRG